MGLLSDIYVSSHEHAADYRGSTPFPEQDRAQYKGITTLELTTLWALLDKKEWNVDLLETFEEVLYESDGEVTIHKVPEAFVTRLSKLSQSEIAAVSRLWAETEELQWKTEEAAEVIDALVKLSARAIETGKQLYIWNCI